MKLAQIRIDYNQRLTKAEQGTPERDAYLSIYYCLRRFTEKRAAIAPMRRLLKAAPEETRELYQEALAMLETPDKPRGGNYADHTEI